MVNVLRVNRCKNRKSGMMKKTKIVCSIGPASCSVDTMTQMVNVGMNVARINFSHATLEEKQDVVETVKKVREITKKHIIKHNNINLKILSFFILNHFLKP
jgi:pyruvate kinase